jgi:hypothetical protein
LTRLIKNDIINTSKENKTFKERGADYGKHKDDKEAGSSNDDG